jgi:hypothetical protein
MPHEQGDIEITAPPAAKDLGNVDLRVVTLQDLTGPLG